MTFLKSSAILVLVLNCFQIICFSSTETMIHPDENQRYDSVVIIMTTSNLQTLLDSDLSAFADGSPSAAQKTFRLFPRILMVIQGTKNNGEDILRRVAEYNMKHHGNVSYANALNLWIGIKPDDNYSTSVLPVLQGIRKANDIFKGSVSTIVLLYGEFDLARISTAKINSDIQRITSEESLYNLKLAIAVKRLLLLRNDNHLRDLRQDHVEYLMVSGRTSHVLTKREDLFAELVSNFDWLKHFNWKFTPVAHLPFFITFDLNQPEIVDYQMLHDLTEIPKDPFGRQIIVTIDSKFVVNPESNDKPKFIAGTKGFTNWLGTTSQFSKSSMGISVNTSQVSLNFPAFMPVVLGTFNKVLLTIDGIKDDHITQVAKYSNSSNIKPEIDLLLENPKSNVSINKDLADETLSVFDVGNRQLPGLVKSVYFDMMACTKGILSVTPQDPLRYDEYLLEWAQCSEVYMVAKRQVKTRGAYPNLGIVLDLPFLTHVLALSQSTSFNTSAITTVIASADILIMKNSVPNQILSESGAISISRKMVYRLRHARTIAELINNSSKILFLVGVVGCTGNSRNVTELTEFVRFVKILNNWASAENTTVYFETALEGTVEGCSGNISDTNMYTCPCGWWQMQTQDEYAISLTLAASSFGDKKSIARRILDKERRTDRDGHPTVGPHQTSVLLEVGISAVIVVVLTVAAVIAVICYYRSKYVISNKEVQRFLTGAPTVAMGQPEKQLDGSQIAERQTYNKTLYEISPQMFKIDFTCILGSGEFGVVYGAKITKNDAKFTVAVKTIKTSAERTSHGFHLALKGLISEIKILSYVGEHKNVVALLGAYTAELRKGKMLVFLERCELGSLHKYLRSYQPEVKPQLGGSATEQQNMVLNDSELSKDLLKWADEIANGMEFLASKNMVHADLATRNVLLTVEKCAKISDFGLARRLYDYTEYLKTEPGPLPWRWMAPESLRRLIFNEKSDVWSYGVTLWEMFSMGDEPYPGLSWDVNFPQMLAQGLRLEAPWYTVKGVHSLMMRCWDIDPGSRPTFAQVRQLFE